ncbi:hypothetical protein M422DRAFT_29425, partial [Sphaerobolus stellatus SS14]
DEDTGVTRSQRRGWEFHQLGRRLRCLAFLLRVWMEGRMLFRLSFYDQPELDGGGKARPRAGTKDMWEGVQEMRRVEGWEDG